MPDTPGYRTPFRDYIAEKMPFAPKDTMGDSPRNVGGGTSDRVTQPVTPKELPKGQMDLWYGPGMNRGSGGGK